MAKQQRLEVGGAGGTFCFKFDLHYVFFLYQYITSYDFEYFTNFFIVPKENVMITKQKSEL